MATLYHFRSSAMFRGDFLGGFLHPSFDPVRTYNTPESSIGTDDSESDASEWKSVMVAEWLRRNMRERYGDEWLPERCVHGIVQNMIDGATVGRLSPDDWKELVPLMGPRAHAIKLVSEKFEGAPPGGGGKGGGGGGGGAPGITRRDTVVKAVLDSVNTSVVSPLQTLGQQSVEIKPQGWRASIQSSRNASLQSRGSINPAESVMYLTDTPFSADRKDAAHPYASVPQDVKGLFKRSSFTNARVAKDLNHCSCSKDVPWHRRCMFNTRLTVYTLMYYVYTVSTVPSLVR